MFEALLNRLFEPDPKPLDDSDARLSLAALMVRLARADGDYAVGEVAQIDGLLERRYRLPPEGARALRAEAETLEAEAPDTVRFTRAIKDHVPYEEREAVIESLWELVLSDGRRDEQENALMRQVAPLLGVNDRDSGLARQRVAARRG